MKLDLTNLPFVPNSTLGTIDDLRFSDNSRYYSVLKQLMRSGEDLTMAMGNSKTLPIVIIQVPAKYRTWHNCETLLIYLTPEMESFITSYLQTGDCSNPIKYNNNIISYAFDGDYNLYHLKREQERGITRCEKMTKDGKYGSMFYAKYPYGEIKYGFYPFSPEHMSFLLSKPTL